MYYVLYTIHCIYTHYIYYTLQVYFQNEEKLTKVGADKLQVNAYYVLYYNAVYITMIVYCTMQYYINNCASYIYAYFICVLSRIYAGDAHHPRLGRPALLLHARQGAASPAASAGTNTTTTTITATAGTGSAAATRARA